MIKLTVLIDNSPNTKDNKLETEHGLSLFIEFESHKILCDMGASDRYFENAKRLGIDLDKVSFATISHGHADHTGGLGYFLRNNHHSIVYLSDKIFGRKFYSLRHDNKREISTDKDLEHPYSKRFAYITDSRWVDKNIAIVYNNSEKYASPKANCFLTVSDAHGERADDFSHEAALVLKTDRGLVVISSCSHGGAVNIIDSCCRFTGVENVCAFVGGLHFVDHSQTKEEVDVFLRTMAELAPNTHLYTGHCTGEVAKECLSTQKILPKVNFFYTGAIIEL